MIKHYNLYTSLYRELVLWFSSTLVQLVNERGCFSGAYGLGLKFILLIMQVPFQVPLEVNVVLIGFNGDGGYRYTIDSQKLEEFLRVSFPSHRPSCLETGQPLDIEHHVVYNVFPVSIF